MIFRGNITTDKQNYLNLILNAVCCELLSHLHFNKLRTGLSFAGVAA
jgi:hypothetical protein